MTRFALGVGSQVVKIKNIWFSVGFIFFKLVNGQHAVGNELMKINIDLVFIWFPLFNLEANLKRGNQLALGKEDKKDFIWFPLFNLANMHLATRSWR